MRTLLYLSLVSVGAIGCAPAPVVKLHVNPIEANRLDPAQRQSAAATIEAAKKSLANAGAELKRAEADHAALAVDDKTPSPELEAVKRAVAQRHMALVGWRRAQVEVARWQLASAEAQRELVIAEAVSRTGADVDPAQFRAQSATLQSGRMEAGRKVAHARAQLDEAERAVMTAKDSYAATLKALPPPPITQASNTPAPQQ